MSWFGWLFGKKTSKQSTGDEGLDVNSNIDFLAALMKLAKAVRFVDKCGPLDPKNLKELHQLLGTDAEPARLLISEIHRQLTGRDLEDFHGRRVTLPTDNLDELKSILKTLFRGTFEELKQHFIGIMKQQARTSERARAGLPILERLTPESVLAD